MLTVYEIKQVLEAHASMCLDNERERATVAVAIHKALEASEPEYRSIQGCSLDDHKVPR